MAFGDKVKWTADNTTPTHVPLQHAVSPFPFDATLHIPLMPTVDEASRLAALEDSAIAPPPEVTLAERTLIEIAGNKFMAEATRVRASQLILERYDQKTLIAALRAEIEALKSGKLEEFESA